MPITQSLAVISSQAQIRCCCANLGAFYGANPQSGFEVHCIAEGYSLCRYLYFSETCMSEILGSEIVTLGCPSALSCFPAALQVVAIFRKGWSFANTDSWNSCGVVKFMLRNHLSTVLLESRSKWSQMGIQSNGSSSVAVGRMGRTVATVNSFARAQFLRHSIVMASATVS